ncbi:Beta protein [Amycolatopsis xylanica]|uniref:Beta protein n=1 Tax=Amycolatopsis xylanica TaxID=589385 RepID=A0A1H3SX70_9PSEU|nr:beta family protein [Amycolatopsis xylanica]SDZ42572.1 Beta protein [Amycolatopsis xylanica]
MATPRAHYRPILVTKRGELAAVEELSNDAKARMTPLFVAHPVEWNYETDSPARTAPEHVAGLGHKLAKAMGAGRAFFDPVFLTENTEWPYSEPHPLHTVITDAAERQLRLVPVVGLGRHSSYTAAAAEINRKTGEGACVRLSPQEWPTTPSNIQDLESLLTAIKVDPTNVDLILDLAEEVNSSLAVGLVSTTLSTLPHSSDWRSLTITASSFPKDLSGIQKGNITRIPRRDWKLWNSTVIYARNEGRRIPDFGDYAVSHPDPVVQADPRILSISASLRYTADADWLVAKGELFKGRGGTGSGGDAAIHVAQMIADAPEYCGRDYSAGDLWIHQVATTASNGGNPERWRRTATNHHLTFVTNSLANPGETSNEI